MRQHDPEFEAAGTSNVPMVPGETHQLHVGLERLRAPELIFQPHMIGLTKMGLADTIEFILKQYTPEEQNRLVGNIFLTGGPVAFPGVKERLERELLQMRPFKSKFQVNIAKNTNLNAWHGARDFAQSDSLPEFLISRKDYEEKGGEYFKVHSASNLYFPSPDPLPQAVAPSEPVIVDDSAVDVEIE